MSGSASRILHGNFRLISIDMLLIRILEQQNIFYIFFVLFLRVVDSLNRFNSPWHRFWRVSCQKHLLAVENSTLNDLNKAQNFYFYVVINRNELENILLELLFCKQFNNKIVYENL